MSVFIQTATKTSRLSITWPITTVLSSELVVTNCPWLTISPVSTVSSQDACYRCRMAVGDCHSVFSNAGNHTHHEARHLPADWKCTECNGL